jgi:hypothetical protein
MMTHEAYWAEVTTPDGEYLDEVGQVRAFFAACPCGWRSEDTSNPDETVSLAQSHREQAEAEYTSLLWAEDARF